MINKETQDNIHTDPEYLQAISQMQRGEWQDAMAAFQKLRERYPDSPVITSALESIEFKADHDNHTKIRAKRYVFPWRSILARTAFVAIFLILIWQGFLIFNRGIAPILASAAAQRQQAVWLKEGQDLASAGNWDAAEEQFKLLLSAVPDHPEAQAGLAEIEV